MRLRGARPPAVGNEAPRGWRGQEMKPGRKKHANDGTPRSQAGAWEREVAAKYCVNGGYPREFDLRARFNKWLIWVADWA
jgi:hypothetical protein